MVAGHFADNAMLSSMETPQAAVARLPAMGKCFCHEDHVAVFTMIGHVKASSCTSSALCTQLLPTGTAMHAHAGHDTCKARCVCNQYCDLFFGVMACLQVWSIQDFKANHELPLGQQQQLS